MGEFDDIVPEFIAESTELLEEVENGLLRLEQGDFDQETINTVFRAIHSIKGGAGFVGLTKIERLAHKMEDLLNLIRGGDLQPSQPVTDALLQSLDVLTALFQRVDEHAAIDVDGPIRALEAALSAGVEQEVKAQYDAKGSPNPKSGLPNFQVSNYVLRAKLGQGNLFWIHLNLRLIEKRGLTPTQLINEMLSMGELLDSIVDLPDAGNPHTYEVAEVSFDVLYSTVLDADLLSAALRLEESEFRLVGEDDFAQNGLGEPAPPEEPAARPTPPPQAQPQAAAKPQRRNQPPAAKAEAQPPARREQPAPVVEPPEPSEFLTLTLGSEVYGVDILSVQEIIGLPDLTKLPRSPNHVLGVMNLRGMVVPVIDLRLKLRLAETVTDPVVVVVRVGEKIMGAVVDGVNDVIQIEPELVQEAPDFSGAIKRDYLSGLIRHDDDMVILLAIDRLLAPEALGNAA